jgi:probable F420-dependent oxidoreductase
MDYGIAIFLTDETIGPAHLARLVEERGFRSLFLPEHTHIPAGRETPYRPGGELPRHYWRCLDPFVALTAAAAASTDLRVGTGVCLLIQRDPITTAKEVATLDLLSGGRFEFGIGAGWNKEEIENHGTPFDRRFRILRERMQAMQAIWTDDEATFHGEYVNFDRITSWPKPVQRPYPPVLLGGNGPTVLDRVLAYADGWMPNIENDLGARVAELHRRTDEAGSARKRVAYFGADRDAGAVERLTAAGVDEIQFYLPSADAGTVERTLDEVAALRI